MKYFLFSAVGNSAGVSVKLLTNPSVTVSALELCDSVGFTYGNYWLMFYFVKIILF